MYFVPCLKSLSNSYCDQAISFQVESFHPRVLLCYHYYVHYTTDNVKHITRFVTIVWSCKKWVDIDEPEFEGTFDECEAWIVDNEQEYLRPETDHDLYSLEIISVWSEKPLALRGWGFLRYQAKTVHPRRVPPCIPSVPAFTGAYRGI